MYCKETITSYFILWCWNETFVLTELSKLRSWFFLFILNDFANFLLNFSTSLRIYLDLFRERIYSAQAQLWRSLLTGFFAALRQLIDRALCHVIYGHNWNTSNTFFSIFLRLSSDIHQFLFSISFYVSKFGFLSRIVCYSMTYVLAFCWFSK